MSRGRLIHYTCGHTTHRMDQLIHGFPREKRIFPAGAFLYRHPDGRTVLFDTGYAPATWRAGVKGFLYNLLLPAHLAPGEGIGEQLRADGIDPDTIDFVVLSHLHPDHIGGVRHFPQATFVLSRDMLETFDGGRVREGFIAALLPPWFGNAKHKVVDVEGPGVDLLGDGSYLLVALPGHAKGHVGALVEKQVLLAGDAAWGADLMDAALQVKPLPKAITHDWAQYEATLQRLQDMQKCGITLVFSHDPLTHKELLA